MEDDSAITRRELRDTLGPALDEAREYCEEVAPIKYGGCLFVDASEIPTQADGESVANGTAKAMAVKDFTAIPTIGD